MEEKRNNNIELRSEKVRNLVGQIPPCSTSIWNHDYPVCNFSFGIYHWFFPYKHLTSGKCEIYDISQDFINDSLLLNVQLAFEKEGDLKIENNSQIRLITPDYEAEGILVHYSAVKTTDGKNKAIIKIPAIPFGFPENSQVNFILTVSNTSLIHKMMHSNP